MKTLKHDPVHEDVGRSRVPGRRLTIDEACAAADASYHRVEDALAREVARDAGSSGDVTHAQAMRWLRLRPKFDLHGSAPRGFSIAGILFRYLPGPEGYCWRRMHDGVWWFLGKDKADSRRMARVLLHAAEVYASAIGMLRSPARGQLDKLPGRGCAGLF